MKTKEKITLSLIRSFKPCYKPKDIGFIETKGITPLGFIEKYRDKVKEQSDIIWLLCRNEFMTEREQRLFAVWCALESFKLQEKVDERSIEAVNVAERFANGTTTNEELSAARSAAWSDARSAAKSAAWSAAWSAASDAWSAARSAAWYAAWSAASAASAQIDRLVEMFKENN